MTIYVGNLAPETGMKQLASLFAPFGAVEKVLLMTDPQTGQSRGFGFVDMADDEAFQAVDALDGQEFMGSILRVNKARDRGAKAPRRAW